jgi:xanthine dehydrogenase large subunit
MTSQALAPDAKVRRSLSHDSAREHVTGRAVYVDDIPEPRGLLYAALVTSPVAHGQLHGVDASIARAMPGVHAVITAADIPGRNDIAPIGQGEVLFAEDVVEFCGQPVAAVIADTLDQARKAAAAVRLDIALLPPLLTVSEAIARQSYVRAPMRLERGDVDAAMAGASHRVSGHFAVGGQEHFYLEGQVAFAWIDEGGAISLHSSTQHPSEVQHICARLLGAATPRSLCWSGAWAVASAARNPMRVG